MTVEALANLIFCLCTQLPDGADRIQCVDLYVNCAVKYKKEVKSIPELQRDCKIIEDKRGCYDKAR